MTAKTSSCIITSIDIYRGVEVMSRDSYNTLFPATVSSGAVIKAFVLEFLQKQDARYGYEITRYLRDQFAEEDGMGWKPPSGQIYRVLKGLEDNKLVESKWEPISAVHGRPTRRVFKLTEAGKEAVEKVRDQNQAVVMSAIRTVIRVGIALYGPGRVLEAVAKAIESPVSSLPGGNTPAEGAEPRS